MKHAAASLAFAAAAALTASAALPENAPPPAAPELGRAYVTIPYTELRALWEAGRREEDHKKDEPPAPLPYVVQQAEYRLQIGDAVSELQADYEVETLAKGWQSVPLVGGEASLDKVDSAGHSVVWKDGYSLLVNEAGKTPVKLHLAAGGRAKMTSPGAMRLHIGSASVSRLSISGMGEGMEVRVNGERASEIKDGVALFHLSSEAGDVSIELAPPKADPAPKPLKPSQWKAESQVVARLRDGRMRYLARVFAHATDGSGAEATFALPAGAATVTAVGDDLADSSVNRSEDGRESTLRIRWKTRDVLDRELMIGYEVPQPPLSEQWTLTAPEAAGDKGVHNLYAIIIPEGMELKGEGAQVAAAAQRLPQWMRGEIQGAAIVTAEAGRQLSLGAKWLPVVETPDAIVSDVKGELRLVADGAMRSSMTFTIRHSTPLAWRVELPPSVELLSCSLDGRSVRPILREPGILEISLPADVKDSSAVALVFAARTKAFDPVSGQISLDMPRTPLFVEHMEWSVTIPELFEITALEGNATAMNGRGAGVPAAPVRTPNVIALRKDFYRGERPSVSLFYQRQTLEK